MPTIGENYTLESFTLAPSYTKDSNILILAFPLNVTPNSSVSPDKFIGSGAFGTVWAVTDPRSGERIALKKLTNVFQNYVSAIRTYREIRILQTLRHQNILTAKEFLLPPRLENFREIYILMELMQTDLHKIMTSSQILSVNHIKLFLYQILRGLKYLHSAKLMHRDIKPGNLLVNSNCLLKICDFGLARSMPENPFDEYCKSSIYMTTEVVTQYYRAPELLMGATWYNSAIDVWSVGCIFAELFTRKILFESTSPILQLELITDLLGTPSYIATRYACQEARNHFFYHTKPKLPCISPLLFPNRNFHTPTLNEEEDSSSGHNASPNEEPLNKDQVMELLNVTLPITHEALHLLLRMLVFDPDQRISAEQALQHPFVDEGRRRFKETFLRRHLEKGQNTNNNDTQPANTSSYYKYFRKNTFDRHHAHNNHHNHSYNNLCDDVDIHSTMQFPEKFDSTFESPLKSTKQVKAALHSYLMDVYEWKNEPLLINQFSPMYTDFAKPPPYSNSPP